MIYFICSYCGHKEPFNNYEQVIGELDGMDLLYWPHSVDEDRCFRCVNEYLHWGIWKQLEMNLGV